MLSHSPVLPYERLMASYYVQYEEMLRLADDIGGTHKQAKARASIIYFSSRMEAVRFFPPSDDDPLSER